MWKFSERFFTTYPSRDLWKPADHEQLARILARVEPDAEELPLQPNNSVQFIPYHPEHHKYGEGASLQAFEQHFEQCSDLVLELVCRDVPLRRRRVLAFAALMTAAAGASADLDELAERLDHGRRAWAAVTTLLGSGADPRVAEAYNASGERLRAVTLAIWQRPWLAVGDTFLDGWRRSIGDLSCRLGELGMLGKFAPQGAVLRWRTLSEQPAVAFAIENCAHLLCNRLGITLGDEWLLRSLAARAATEVLDGLRRDSNLGSGQGAVPTHRRVHGHVEESAHPDWRAPEDHERVR
jgi:Lantibiotic biosynthesis dehydratase C-term